MTKNVRLLTLGALAAALACCLWSLDVLVGSEESAFAESLASDWVPAKGEFEVPGAGSEARTDLSASSPGGSRREGSGSGYQPALSPETPSPGEEGVALPWRADFDRKYREYSMPEIVYAKRDVGRRRSELFRELAKTYLDAGRFVETADLESLEDWMIPVSDTEGEGIRQSLTSHVASDGAITYRWVFVQPSQIPEALRSIEREHSYLAIRGRELGEKFPE